MKNYSVSETAELLGVCDDTVYGLCARKKIRHERIGLGRGTIRIPEDAIEEYRKSVTVGKREAAPAGEPPARKRKVTLEHLRMPS